MTAQMWSWCRLYDFLLNYLWMYDMPSEVVDYVLHHHYYTIPLISFITVRPLHEVNCSGHSEHRLQEEVRERLCFKLLLMFYV